MRIRAHSVVVSGAGLILVAVGAFFFLHWRNGRAFDTWVGKQVLGVVESYLEPRVDFASVEYRSPHTVDLKNVSLTSPDGTRVTDIDGVTIELVRAPVIGQPLLIRRIIVGGASVHLVETTRGHFKGLRPFLRASPGKENEKKIPKNWRLSTVLQLEKLEIRNSSLDYVPADGSPPMVLDGLTLDLNVNDAPAKEPGWYGIDTSFGRPPQCTISANGMINLDTLMAEVDSAELRVEIGEASIAGLPPRLQEIIRRYDARGLFKMSLRGRAPLLSISSGDLACNIAVDGFGVSSGQYVFPIDHGTGSLDFKDGKVTLRDFVLTTLGGEVRARGLADLSRPDRRADLAWQISQVDLRALLRGGSDNGKPPKLAGTLDGSGAVRTSLDSPRQSLSGTGKVAVRDGRLLVIPGLKELAEFFNGDPETGGMRHRGVATFDVTPAGIVITESEVTTEFAVATGTGLIGFDKTIDLFVNAGPLGKLGSFLGPVGKAVGRFTDRIVTYHVHGRIGDTKVDVLPLGMGS